MNGRVDWLVFGRAQGAAMPGLRRSSLVDRAERERWERRLMPLAEPRRIPGVEPGPSVCRLVWDDRVAALHRAPAPDPEAGTVTYAYIGEGPVFEPRSVLATVDTWHHWIPAPGQGDEPIDATRIGGLSPILRDERTDEVRRGPHDALRRLAAEVLRAPDQGFSCRLPPGVEPGRLLWGLIDLLGEIVGDGTGRYWTFSTRENDDTRPGLPRFVFLDDWRHSGLQPGHFRLDLAAPPPGRDRYLDAADALLETYRGGSAAGVRRLLRRIGIRHERHGEAERIAIVLKYAEVKGVRVAGPAPQATTVGDGDPTVERRVPAHRRQPYPFAPTPYAPGSADASAARDAQASGAAGGPRKENPESPQTAGTPAAAGGLAPSPSPRTVGHAGSPRAAGGAPIDAGVRFAGSAMPPPPAERRDAGIGPSRDREDRPPGVAASAAGPAPSPSPDAVERPGTSPAVGEPVAGAGMGFAGSAMPPSEAQAGGAETGLPEGPKDPSPTGTVGAGTGAAGSEVSSPVAAGWARPHPRMEHAPASAVAGPGVPPSPEIAGRDGATPEAVGSPVSGAPGSGESGVAFPVSPTESSGPRPAQAFANPPLSEVAGSGRGSAGAAVSPSPEERTDATAEVGDPPYGGSARTEVTALGSLGSPSSGTEASGAVAASAQDMGRPPSSGVTGAAVSAAGAAAPQWPRAVDPLGPGSEGPPSGPSEAAAGSAGAADPQSFDAETSGAGAGSAHGSESVAASGPADAGAGTAGSEASPSPMAGKPVGSPSAVPDSTAGAESDVPSPRTVERPGPVPVVGDVLQIEEPDAGAVSTARSAESPLPGPETGGAGTGPSHGAERVVASGPADSGTAASGPEESPSSGAGERTDSPPRGEGSPAGAGVSASGSAGSPSPEAEEPADSPSAVEDSAEGAGASEAGAVPSPSDEVAEEAVSTPVAESSPGEAGDAEGSTAETAPLPPVGPEGEASGGEGAAETRPLPPVPERQPHENVPFLVQKLRTAEIPEDVRRGVEGLARVVEGDGKARAQLRDILIGNGFFRERLETVLTPDELDRALRDLVACAFADGDERSLRKAVELAGRKDTTHGMRVALLEAVAAHGGAEIWLSHYGPTELSATVPRPRREVAEPVAGAGRSAGSPHPIRLAPNRFHEFKVPALVVFGIFLLGTAVILLFSRL